MVAAKATFDAEALEVLNEALGTVVPTGNKEITQNGENIDVAQYATVTVNVQ